MIDHVSIAVRDLGASTLFYRAVLATLGFTLLVSRERTAGFGKTYPEFWLNHRPERGTNPEEDGGHICLRAGDQASVKAFHEAAMAAGATDAGPPGPRPRYSEHYYAAFMRDPDRNLIEAVTFRRPS